MNKTKINILFLIAKNRMNTSGKCAIKCRITYNKQRHEFSPGLFINPNNWSSAKQQAVPLNTENTQMNTQLSLIKSQINQAFLFLQVQGNNFDVEDIFKKYKGENTQKQIGVVEFYSEYMDRLKKMIGKDFKESTWGKFDEILPALKDYIYFQYKKRDIKLVDLDYNFIENFDYYMKVEKKNSQITINKKIQRLKKVVKLARKQKLIDFNPFEEHKVKQAKTQILFLTKDELEKLKNWKPKSETIEKVLDCYIFCCYTGLGYREMFSLKKTDLKTDDEGVVWIYKQREKTERYFSIPLIFTEPVGILEKYETEEDFLLPRVSNQYFNRILKEIADLLGINKKLTHHTARKTFATTVLLNNNIPIETVSKLLGHSKISTTLSYYAEVMPDKLNLIELKEKLKS